MGLVSAQDTRPLILTLQLDPQSHRFYTEQRVRLFPAAINFLDAHLTLFHHLPGSFAAQIKADLADAAGSHTSFTVRVSGVRSLGRGVAYVLVSTQAQKLRDELASKWSAWLTPQDRQKFQPHLTVQNKVSREEARETLAMLQAGFAERTAHAIGLDLWRYDGGPWQHLQTFSLLPASESQIR